MSGTGDEFGRIHIEPAHRVVAETVRARVYSDAEHREAVDVKADDFDRVTYYVCVAPEQKEVLRVSLFVPCWATIREAIGDEYFSALYAEVGAAVEATPQPMYSLTVAIDLDAAAQLDAAGKDAMVSRMATMKRDVMGAALWVCFKALLAGGKPPRTHYAIPYRPSEMMYVVPSDDLVVVVYAIAFDNHVEQAIAKVFLHEIAVARRQSRDLQGAPSVTFSSDPPHELKQIPGLPLKTSDGFIGYVSLAVSKRIVESGRLEKAVTLAESYRAFLMFHVQATKSQVHTRIRRRASSWLQVLNRAMPEKLNVEKKTIKGRTFNRN